ncbi:MAG: hypothetical protein ABIR11_01700 [Candidatus Limnocylindrales bacterium]
MTSHSQAPRPAKRRVRGVPGLALLFIALAIGVALALLDFLPPGSAWWGAHPMTAQAVGGAILFVQGGLLLTGFLQAREQQRIERVAAAAYASLSQSANDAGRRLLAPVNGADLHALGIGEDDPGSDAGRTTATIDRERLGALGFAITFDEKAGTWRSQRALLEGRLPVLMGDAEFVRRLFRAASRARRDMQASAAQWAPMMLADSQRTDDLNLLRELIYSVEDLIEKLRVSRLISLDPTDWSASDAFVAEATEAYWAAVDRYESVRDTLVAKARLASDAWSERASIVRAGTANQDQASRDR